jgi:tRNA dimethylallyltransferase
MMRAIVLGGPTGVGKSGIAIEISKRLNGEVISADSRQIYRGLKIGTARLDPEEMKGVRHHLMGVLDPLQTYSAGRFARDASEIVAEICQRDKVPLICGGTGFYIKALLEGLFDETNAVDDRDRLKKVRNALMGELERTGPEELHRRLKIVDPDSAERIHPNDSQRIVRALEIFEVSGKPISLHYRNKDCDLGIETLRICLNTNRESLFSEIDRRVEEMFECGLVDEVEGLLRDGYGKDTPAFDSLGYKAVIRCLDGEIELDTAMIEIKKDTRHYAKRQLTWFRKESGYKWIDVGPNIVDEILDEWMKFEERKEAFH